MPGKRRRQRTFAARLIRDFHRVGGAADFHAVDCPIMRDVLFRFLFRTLLKPLQLSPEESIRLVEQLYGNVLEMDVKLAGEADDTRKSSVLSHIQNAVVRREGDAIVVEFPTAEPAADTPVEAKD